MKRHLVILTVVWVVCAAVARGDVVYSSFGPGVDQYDSSQSFAVDFTVPQDQAMAFTTLAGTWALTSIDLALTPVNGTDVVDVYIYADSSGLPGTGSSFVAATQITADNGAQVYSGLFGNEELSGATTYWAVVAGNDSPDAVGWFYNSDSVTGDHTDGDHLSVWNAAANGTNAAFRINAQLTPEPCTLLLAGLTGLAGLCVRRRKRAA